jgi:hydrogenase 3 maturation protease
VAIVGIGHELRGDDGIGVAVARALQPLARPYPWLLVVEGGSAPENCTGALRRFEPDLVLLIDAALIGSAPGTIRWLDWRASAGLSASTHSLPVNVLGSYLTNEFNCEVGLIGIQPADTAIGTPLSAAAQQASVRLVRCIRAILKS